MNLQSVLIVVVLVVLFVAAVLFISKNGGWQQGCGGNCAECHEKCDSKSNKKE